VTDSRDNSTGHRARLRQRLFDGGGKALLDHELVEYLLALAIPRRDTKAQAKALMEELRCLVCQGESIADSNAELAGDMRALVRQRIAAGEQPEQIRTWLIERYGDWVSYRPPVEPLTWPLWAAPLVLVLAGAWLLRKRLVRRRR
jgi:cytochrome c-type biogenesis protein CcmH